MTKQKLIEILRKVQKQTSPPDYIYYEPQTAEELANEILSQMNEAWAVFGYRPPYNSIPTHIVQADPHLTKEQIENSIDDFIGNNYTVKKIRWCVDG